MRADTEMVLRRTSGIYVTVVLMSVISLFGVVGLFAASSPGERFLAVGLLVVPMFFIYRALRLEVRAEHDALYVRGVMRTTRYPWLELRGADVLPLSVIGRTWYLRVLRDGRSPLRLPDLSQFARAKRLENSDLHRMAQLIERQIRSVGGRLVP